MSKRKGRLVLGAVTAIAFAGYTYQALQLPFGTLASPSAAVFPTGVGIAGIVLSVAFIIQTLLSGDQGAIELPTGKSRRETIGFLAATVAVIFLMPPLGRYLAAALYTIVVMKLLSSYSLLTCIIGGAALSLAIVWMFSSLLGVPLPAGTLFR